MLTRRVKAYSSSGSVV